MSRITGFPQDLIEDLYTLLCALNSTDEVDPDLYDELAQSWIQRFFANPDLVWHWMSVTVNTVLGANLTQFRIKQLTNYHHSRSIPLFTMAKF